MVPIFAALLVTYGTKIAYDYYSKSAGEKVVNDFEAQKQLLDVLRYLSPGRAEEVAAAGIEWTHRNLGNALDALRFDPNTKPFLADCDKEARSVFGLGFDNLELKDRLACAKAVLAKQVKPVETTAESNLDQRSLSNNSNKSE